MILKTLLNLFAILTGNVIYLTTSAITGNVANISATGISLLGGILSICQQGVNFCYFLLGDSIYVVLPISVAIILFKYTIAPLIILIRTIFIKGNI